MVAAGGIATGILDDRAFLLPPFTRQDAARAIRSLRIWPLLDGYRGAAPGRHRGLEDLVVRLGQLAVDVPEIAELDLNPVMVAPDGCVLVDVKVRLADAVAGGRRRPAPAEAARCDRRTGSGCTGCRWAPGATRPAQRPGLRGDRRRARTAHRRPLFHSALEVRLSGQAG